MSTLYLTVNVDVKIFFIYNNVIVDTVVFILFIYSFSKHLLSINIQDRVRHDFCLQRGKKYI